MQKKQWIHVLILLALSLAAVTARAAPAWIVIGDSWGVLVGPVQQAKLAGLGVGNFTNLAVGGTTAAQWAADDSGLLTAATDALAALPANDVALVYVSLGGNDILGEWTSQGTSLFPRIYADLAVVRSALLAAKSNTIVLIGGYDILNFASSPICELTGLLTFGNTDPQYVNGILATGGSLFDAFAAVRPRTYSLNVMGALQGMPGNPDLGSWSPAEFITGDCIHLTTEGYTIFNDAMFVSLFQQLGIGTLRGMR